MNTFLFHDGGKDWIVIVVAQSLQAAQELVARESADGNLPGWVDAGRAEVPIGDAKNVYTLKQTIEPPDTSSDRVLFLVDVTGL